jgi:hypothetical protein
LNKACFGSSFLYVTSTLQSILDFSDDAIVAAEKDTKTNGAVATLKQPQTHSTLT